jgi:hypothetical protein
MNGDSLLRYLMATIWLVDVASSKTDYKIGKHLLNENCMRYS